jgi:hypothetical protein
LLIAKPSVRVGLMVIYYMLENRIWLSAVIITLMLSLHIVADNMLFPILFFFVVFNKKISNTKLAALLLPMAFLGFKLFNHSVEIPSGQDAEQYYEPVKIA